MSALAALWELGAQIRLAPNGRLVVAGLDRLPKEQAAKAVEVARSHKAEVMAELSAQVESHKGAPILATVDAPASPALPMLRGRSLGPAGVVVDAGTF